MRHVSDAQLSAAMEESPGPDPTQAGIARVTGFWRAPELGGGSLEKTVLPHECRPSRLKRLLRLRSSADETSESAAAAGEERADAFSDRGDGSG